MRKAFRFFAALRVPNGWSWLRSHLAHKLGIRIQPRGGDKPTIAQCRSGLAFCVQCLERHLDLIDEVALLLADVCHFNDEESATRLKVQPVCFQVLLRQARTRIQHVARGKCALAPKPDFAEPGSIGYFTDSNLNVPLTALPPEMRSGLDDDALASLRRELLVGLGLSNRE